MIRDALIVALAGFTLVACGADDPTTEPAIEVKEGHDVRLGRVVYHVVSFRELSPAAEADRSLVRAVTPAPGHGLYAAFLQACNASDDPIAPSASFRLQDAFGTDYVPVRDGLDPALSFTLGHIGSSACSPREGSAAERTFDGARIELDV